MSDRPRTTEIALVEAVKGIGGELIDKIVVTRPRGKLFKRMLPSVVPGQRPISLGEFAAECCSLPESVLDELDIEDYAKVMDVVGGFIPGGPGKTQ